MMIFKIRNTGLILLFIFFAGIAAQAQDRVETMEPGSVTMDSVYLADYTEELTSRLFLLFQNASLQINPGGEKIDKIVYRPNTNVRIGIAGFWKWLGLGLSMDNPFLKTDRAAYGKTSTLDFRVNLFGRVFAGEFFLQKYKGFFISSPEMPGGSHYIVPDMGTFSIGVAGYWIYNSGRFSIRAAYTQNESQKKSAGSLVIRPSFLYFLITSPHGIVPAAIIDTFRIPAANLVTKGRFYSFGLSPGYIYTLVFLRHFYATAAVFPGIAVQFSLYSNEEKSTSGYAFNFQLGGRLVVGYNSEKWFLGGSVQTGFNEVPDRLSNALFSYDVAQVRFWGGTRFDIFKKKKRAH